MSHCSCLIVCLFCVNHKVCFSEFPLSEHFSISGVDSPSSEGAAAAAQLQGEYCYRLYTNHIFLICVILLSHVSNSSLTTSSVFSKLWRSWRDPWWRTFVNIFFSLTNWQGKQLGKQPSCPQIDFLKLGFRLTFLPYVDVFLAILLILTITATDHWTQLALWLLSFILSASVNPPLFVSGIMPP